MLSNRKKGLVLLHIDSCLGLYSTYYYHSQKEFLSGEKIKNNAHDLGMLQWYHTEIDIPQKIVVQNM